jgi:hypothetical protein
MLAEVVPSLHALSYPLSGNGYAFWSGIGSDVGEATIIASIVGSAAMAYRHIECHQEGCHRLGRFRHGHLKLCHVHHPLVPNDGKITQAHVRAVGSGPVIVTKRPPTV